MIKTNAIIIRTADYNETDRMITLLTRDRGLLSAKVKAAKKQTSKLFCSSSLFCCGEYEFYEKGGYYGVRGCEITHSFQKLPQDYEAYSTACFIADAAGKVAQEDFEEPKLFALVVNALYALESSVAPDTVLCYFIQRLLFLEGLYPGLDACVLCGRGDVSHFSQEHGGAVCGQCAQAHGGKRIDKKILGALSGMAGVLPKDIANVRIQKEIENSLKHMLISYLEYVLQRPLKTSKFVNDVL